MHADDEPFYSGASEVAYQKFVMGFGPVAVPEGCEVAEVKLALQARDYYQVWLRASLCLGCRVFLLVLQAEVVDWESLCSCLCSQRVPGVLVTFVAPVPDVTAVPAS
jgi:hypothetical protein